MSRKHFKSEEKSSKRWKNVWFSVFFIIEQVFFKGIHRKTKKVKTLFASILIPSFVFYKIENTKNWKTRIQFIMKITFFLKIKNVYNAKTLWKQFQKIRSFQHFNLKIHLQWHIRKFAKITKRHFSTPPPSLLRAPGILKSHGTVSSEGRSNVLLGVVLWWVRFCMSLEIRPALWKSTRLVKKTQKR